MVSISVYNMAPNNSLNPYYLKIIQVGISNYKKHHTVTRKIKATNSHSKTTVPFQFGAFTILTTTNTHTDKRSTPLLNVKSQKVITELLFDFKMSDRLD